MHKTESTNIILFGWTFLAYVPISSLVSLSPSLSSSFIYLTPFFSISLPPFLSLSLPLFYSSPLREIQCDIITNYLRLSFHFISVHSRRTVHVYTTYNSLHHDSFHFITSHIHYACKYPYTKTDRQTDGHDYHTYLQETLKYYWKWKCYCTSYWGSEVYCHTIEKRTYNPKEEKKEH